MKAPRLRLALALLAVSAPSLCLADLMAPVLPLSPFNSGDEMDPELARVLKDTERALSPAQREEARADCAARRRQIEDALAKSRAAMPAPDTDDLQAVDAAYAATLGDRAAHYRTAQQARSRWRQAVRDYERAPSVSSGQAAIRDSCVDQAATAAVGTLERQLSPLVDRRLFLKARSIVDSIRGAIGL